MSGLDLSFNGEWMNEWMNEWKLNIQLKKMYGKSDWGEE